MKIGACSIPPAEWKSLAGIGYDYIEGNFSDICSATEAEFDDILRLQAESGLAVEVCNCFFPGSLALYAYSKETGDGTEAFSAVEQTVLEYIEKGLSRVSRLGTRICVIGSGGARAIPADMKRATADRQFGRIVALCAHAAAAYGIAITVEPLSPSATNYLNTLSECLDFMERERIPNIFAMNDFYHSMQQSEPLSALERAGQRLVHLHIAKPQDRSAPSLADLPAFADAFRLLASMNYPHRLSLECKSADPLLAAAAAFPLLDLLRKQLEHT